MKTRIYTAARQLSFSGHWKRILVTVLRLCGCAGKEKEMKTEEEDDGRHQDMRRDYREERSKTAVRGDS